MGDRGGNGKVTIHDVARKAGVSVMTVSRAMRGIDGVSESTRKRVVTLAREMHYLPNSNAAALVGAESKLIGISIPTLFNEVFSDMLMGMRRTFEQAGYASVIDTTDYCLERERRFLERLLAWQPAAAILTGRDHDAEVSSLLRGRGVPCLQLWDLPEDPIDLCVGIDHRKSGEMLGRHLSTLGYRSPAFVGGPRGRDTRADGRFDGLATAFSAVGARELRLIVVSGDSDFEKGAKGIDALDPHDLPDVLCFLNDHLAVGGLMRAEALGWHAPQDFGVAGFNALTIANVLPRPLTTVATPRREMGLVGARNLLARLNGVEPPRITSLPCQLVEGMTTRTVT